MDTDGTVHDWIAEVGDRISAGKPAVLDRLAEEQPDGADTLRRLFPAMEAMARLRSSMATDGLPDCDRTAEETATIASLSDFRTTRVIGRGGMAVVYEAVQVSLNRRVALKILPMTSAEDPRKLRRFQVEAQAAALLHHPHIVPVHLVGSEGGVHYYAMQLIEGQTLGELIAAHRLARDGQGRPKRDGHVGPQRGRDGPAGGLGMRTLTNREFCIATSSHRTS